MKSVFFYLLLSTQILLQSSLANSDQSCFYRYIQFPVEIASAQFKEAYLRNVDAVKNFRHKLKNNKFEFDWHLYDDLSRQAKKSLEEKDFSELNKIMQSSLEGSYAVMDVHSKALNVDLFHFDLLKNTPEGLKLIKAFQNDIKKLFIKIDPNSGPRATKHVAFDYGRKEKFFRKLMAFSRAVEADMIEKNQNYTRTQKFLKNLKEWTWKSSDPEDEIIMRQVDRHFLSKNFMDSMIESGLVLSPGSLTRASLFYRKSVPYVKQTAHMTTMVLTTVQTGDLMSVSLPGGKLYELKRLSPKIERVILEDGLEAAKPLLKAEYGPWINFDKKWRVAQNVYRYYQYRYLIMFLYENNEWMREALTEVVQSIRNTSPEDVKDFFVRFVENFRKVYFDPLDKALNSPAGDIFKDIQKLHVSNGVYRLDSSGKLVFDADKELFLEGFIMSWNNLQGVKKISTTKEAEETLQMLYDKKYLKYNPSSDPQIIGDVLYPDQSSGEEEIRLPDDIID